MTADFGAERVDLGRESDFRIGGITVRPSIRQVESGGAAETLEPGLDSWKSSGARPDFCVSEQQRVCAQLKAM